MQPQDEQGFTLIELIVTMAVGALVLSLAASFIVASLRAQSTVSTQTDSTTSAQLALRSLQQGLENAPVFTVTNGSQPGDIIVIAPSLSPRSSAAWTCHAWRYSASASTISVATWNDGNTFAAETLHWTSLATRVSPKGATPVFLAGPHNMTDPTPNTVLEVTFVGTGYDGHSVSIVSQIASSPSSSGAGIAC
ncbi:PulJ/GspJ family protein [Gryllotalpicola protaetiae]|uniref:PulJ/GspJ family protein n=1 Tax=Gryllotalpicola protaetiae TaxID=2419771 RepID=UPI0013C48E54|nr:prepilin-type N-terminal cleavage/methylation domain-containing protein [Gryllotalpicola protaetiae]